MTTEENFLTDLEKKQGKPLSYDQWEKARAYYSKCVVSRMKLKSKAS